MKKILMVIAVLGLGLSNASAQYGRQDGGRYDDRHPYEYRQERSSDINFLQRQARQQITVGIQRGTISQREANALINRYERIEARERQFSHRGRLSPKEARILRGDLERLMADTRRMSSRRGDHWARDRRNRY